MSFKYRVYSCNRLLSTMANTLPNAMNKSMVEFISSARQRLETVRHCSGTMAAAFPAHTLAAGAHSATAGYPARSSKMLDFDGKSARMGMTSCLITVISPSDTVGHIASYGIPNATMRRFRNRSQNGAERRQPRWRLIEYSPILLVRVVRKIGKCSWVYKKVIHVFHIHLPIFL